MSSQPEARPPGILVVEDEAIVAQDIAQILQTLGYRVVGIASSGELAVQMAENLKPAAILMDVQLRGEMDGIGAATLIRAASSAPIVYLTAFTGAETMKRAMCTEPFGYVVKPWREADLHFAIEIALTRHRSEEARRERENEYQRLSLVDDLTHLHNRRGFQLLAEQQLKVARHEKLPLALFFIDINGLKKVNDQYGHAEGDRLLCSAARVLNNTFRAKDIIARLSGDEFAILAMGITVSESEGVLQRLRNSTASFNAAETRLELQMSVGVALGDPDSAASMKDLLAQADAAMYANKRAIKG